MFVYCSFFGCQIKQRISGQRLASAQPSPTPVAVPRAVPQDGADGPFRGEALSDKDRQPWSVRGVTGEARARAARAAHRRRMTIGEWVTETILKAAARDLGETADTPGAVAGLPAVQTAPDPQLAGALGALVRHLEKGGGTGMGEVARRVERTEAILTGRMEQIAAALYAVMQSVERGAARTVEHDGAREAALAVEQARLAEQVARIAGQEQRRQDQMGAIAEALTLLAGKVDQAGRSPEPEPLDLDQPISFAVPQPAAPAPALVPEAEADGSSPAPASGTDSLAPTEEPAPRPAPQPRPRHSVHHDPRAEEVAAEIRAAAKRPPEMPDDDEEERPRRGLFGRLLRRD